MTVKLEIDINLRHFLTKCLILILIFQMVIAIGGKQKLVKKSMLVKNVLNATERKDGWWNGNPDISIFSSLSRIIKETDTRIKVPPNYLQVVLNASGVLGLGFLWIKEISGALGTPILAPILMPPLILLSAAILLIPDLSTLGELIDNVLAH